MHLVDPETTPRHECIDRVIRYTQRRVPEYLGWPKRKLLGPKELAWFFQTRMPTKLGTLVPMSGGGYVLRRTKKPLWEW